MTELLTLTSAGLYCADGDFHVDPWTPVPRAVVTHAHADHARPGSDAYLCATAGLHVLRARMGEEARIETLEWGAPRRIGSVTMSLHPAGHVLGSAQVRIERDGEVWVVSGDYKRDADPTCTPFEPVPCHTFVTESTFGLPIYRWPDPRGVTDEINDWWRANRDAGRASILYGYALGKAQRLLAGLDPSIGPIHTHGAVETLNAAYRASRVRLPDTSSALDRPRGTSFAGAMIVAPPSAHGTAWQRRFEPAETAVASGWMRVRGVRRRRAMDRGFVLSDHVDWPGLLETVRETGAERVWVTHGSADAAVRWFREEGLDATSVPTRFTGESLDAAGEEA